MNLNDIKTALAKALKGDPTTITTQVQIGNTTFPISATINPGDKVVQAEASFAAGSPPAFSDLVSFIGLDAFMKSLPQPLRAGLNIQVAGVAFAIAVKTKTLTSVSCTLSLADLSTNPPSLTIANTGLSITVTNPLDGKTRSIEGVLSGTLNIGSAAVDVSAAMPGKLVLTGTIPTINLSALAATLLQSVSLPAGLPKFDFTNVAFSVTPQTGAFSLSGTSASAWDLPVGINGLSLSDVALSVNRAVGADKKMAVSGTIGGTLNIGSASLAVTYNFPGDFVLKGTLPSFRLSPLVQDLCGGALMQDLPVPVSVLNVQFTDISVSIAPQVPSFSLAGKSSFGQTELIVKKVKKKWGFGVGFAPPASWKLSNIDQALAALDIFSFGGTTLVVSSSSDASFKLTTIGPTGDGVKVSRGLNLYAAIDLSKLGLEDFIGVASLNVYAAIGPTPADLVIGASIQGKIALGSNVAFGNIVFQLRPTPKDFSLQLLGELSVVLDKNPNPLLFVGGLSIKLPPPSAAFAVTMRGSWVEPFGAKGVTVSDVAIDLGLSFGPPPVPTFGIAGTLSLGGGTIKGSVAVKFAGAKSMLAVEIIRLNLNDVIQEFCGPGARSIPEAVRTTVLNMGMENVKIYIVPQPTQIGTMKYEQGFTVEGTIKLWGVSGYIFVNIDYTTGVVVYGEIDPIRVAGGLFSLTGAGGKPKASIALHLRKGKPVFFHIDGAVSLLGLTLEAQVTINDKGFSFTVTGKILDLFEATITVRGSNPTQGGGFMIHATMKNDLFKVLREEASKAIDAAAKGAMAEISKAQTDVNNLRAKVNGLTGDINRLRSTIQSERDRNTNKLRIAERDLRNAQNAVNSLNGQIRNNKNRINQLSNDIRNDDNWFNGLKWWDKPGALPGLGWRQGKRNAEIAALWTAIAGLESGKWGAQRGLDIAIGVVNGIRAAATAIPIDLDPRIVGLFTAKETANAALIVADRFLEGVKQSIGGMAAVGNFIVKAGLGGLIDIKKASFTASLGAAKGGSVSLSVTLKFMGGPQQTLSFTLNFNNILSGAQDLAKQLMP